MNYKSIIRSRALRIKILKLFDFLPDEAMVKLQYRIKLKRKLNLNNPQRYTEKLQWYKLYYRDAVMCDCVDKYKVRSYIKSLGLEHILNECIGVYNYAEEINFQELPSKFVIKDTLGGGGNSIIICTDKSIFNIVEAKKKINSWLIQAAGKNPGREWVYDGKKSQIIVESYLDSDTEQGGLIDYKFFCFNGKVSYVYGIADRVLGVEAGLGIYDKQFNLLPYTRADEKPLKRKLAKPKNYDKMIEIAERISARFPHARIDLYNNNGKIIFGEITFFDGSGYMSFCPDEFDIIMGSKFILPNRNH